MHFKSAKVILLAIRRITVAMDTSSWAIEVISHI